MNIKRNHFSFNALLNIHEYSHNVLNKDTKYFVFERIISFWFNNSITMSLDEV